MARKRSLWAELQRERERRARVAAAQARAQQQLVRKMEQAHRQAERRAAQAEATERKRQEQLAHEAGMSTAKAMKDQLQSRLAELRTILTSVLTAPHS